jgi:hypothetical protein
MEKVLEAEAVLEVAAGAEQEVPQVQVFPRIPVHQRGTLRIRVPT